MLNMAFLALEKQKSVAAEDSVAINHDLEQLDFSKSAVEIGKLNLVLETNEEVTTHCAMKHH